MKRNKNIKGKRAAFNDSLPNANAKPAIHTSTKPNAHKDGDIGGVLIFQRTIAIPGIKNMRQTRISEDTGLKIRSRSMNINQAQINGIKRMWDASSFPNE
jgi:hypothetical protein